MESRRRIPEATEYARRGPRNVSELLEEGQLLATRVEGWREPAYMQPGVRVPLTVDARALVTPFDSLVWERSRIERLFGMKYTIELYGRRPNGSTATTCSRSCSATRSWPAAT